MKFSPDRIVELLVKSHTGSLDKDEQESLEKWLVADKQNRDLYERLSDDQYLQQQYAIYKSSDYPDGWQELKRGMEASARRKSLKRKLFRLGASAAASVIIVASILLVKWSPDEKMAQAPDYSIHNVVPGRNEAVIELESGEKIILNEKQSRNMDLLSEVGTISGDSMVQYNVPAGGSKAKAPEKHTFRVPKGATTKVIVLADGTTVWLNAGSSITYPVQFVGEERLVAITGECYFDVNQQSGKPFIVETQDIKIRVTGTEFNVMSYANEKNVETTLVSGRVCISASNKEVMLKPGVQAVYNKESSDIALRDVDTRIITAWKEGVFVFNNMTIENICMVLSRWYDIEFEFEDYKARGMLFNGTLKRDKTLAFVLDRMKDTRTINYKMEDGKVIIMKR